VFTLEIFIRKEKRFIFIKDNPKEMNPTTERLNMSICADYLLCLFYDIKPKVSLSPDMMNLHCGPSTRRQQSSKQQTTPKKRHEFGEL